MDVNVDFIKLKITHSVPSFLLEPLGSNFLGAVGSWFFWFFLIINVSHDKMKKFVEDPVVNLDDDNSASNESGGEEQDELGDKNGPVETDYISSIGSEQEDSDFNKVARLGAVVAAHSRLGEIVASKRDLFKDICDDLFKLVNKYENLVCTYTIHTSSVQDIGDTTMVKTKGAPRKRKDSKKCSHCNNVGHKISTCSKLLRENDQYTKDDNLASSNSLASDSEHDNDKEGNQHDEDKLQPSMPKKQSKTAKDKNVKEKLSQKSKRKGNKVKCSTQSSLYDTSKTRHGFQPNMTRGGSMPAFVQGIHPYPLLSGVRPEIPQGVYGFPHYGHGVASQGLSPFLPYVGYPFFNQNLHHHPVYQQFPQYLNGGEKANSSQSFHGLLQEVIKNGAPSSMSMVGGGRTRRNRGTPTAPKETPRGRGRPPSASKRKQAIDFIEISSSNNISVEDNGETKHIFPMNVHKNDKSSLRSNLDNNSNSKMDQWMPTLFPIPASMILDEIEAAVSLYIFGSNKDDQKSGKEVLINYTCWGQGNRETLKSLMPNKEVDQEQLALGMDAPYEPPKALMDFYKKDFMGTVEVLRKIFFPINDEKHWYLLVVDMSKQQLILLDSKPDLKRSMWRRLYVQKMVLPKSRMCIAIDLV
ncbi:hypothetical protein RIF29_04307 [Crotalaria pallida]|uniref:Ubiquitin-like protease family profile domain-containing protein n=1 Tax=Crotalaria pallida TaxID=3830 RepID=A0AAN9J0V5_CROPI